MLHWMLIPTPCPVRLCTVYMCVCIYPASNGALNHWENEVPRPRAGGASGEC